MLRGIYASATGMAAQAQRLDVLSNNLANAATVGYKRDVAVSLSFQDLLQQRLDDRQDAGRGTLPVSIGRVPAGTALTTATRLADGPLRATGRGLDVALQGDGFFTVSTPQGIRYTRAGNFAQDAEGRLVTPAGHPVLVGGQAVRGREIEIREDAGVWVDGRLAGYLDIVTTQQAGALRKVGDNLWAVSGDGAPLVGATVATGASGTSGEKPWRLQVGFLEMSNVEPLREMVELIQVTRSFEANQQALRAQDEALGRAVNDLAGR